MEYVPEIQNKYHVQNLELQLKIQAILHETYKSHGAEHGIHENGLKQQIVHGAVMRIIIEHEE